MMLITIIWTATLSFIFLDMAFGIGPAWAFYYRMFILAAATVFGAAYYYFRVHLGPSPSSAARAIEKLDPCDECLSTAVEISPADVERYGFSEPLYHATIDRAADFYLKKDPASYVDRSLIRKLSFAAALLAVTTVLAFSAGGSLKRLNRIWPELAGLFIPAPLEIASRHRDFTAYVDEEIDLAFSFGRAEPVELHILDTADGRKNPFLQIDFDALSSDGARVYKLSPAAAAGGKGFEYSLRMPAPPYNFYYRARSTASDSFSATYFVTSKRRPEITKLNAAYEFPKYTGIAPMVEENVTSISGLYMSAVRLTAHSSAPLGSARIIFSQRPPLEMELTRDGRAASIKFRLEKKDSYRIELTDAEGVKSRETKMNEITVYEDRPPSCEIIEPAGLINAPYERRVDVTIKAKDDFAVSKLALVYYRDEKEEESFEISLHENSPSEIFEKAPLDFGFMTFKPGESLYYYAVAWDNDDVSGPKSSRSAVHRIAFPTQFDEAAELEALYGSIETRLEKIASDQKAIAERVEKIDALQRQGAMNDYEMKKNYENIARNQQNLMNEAKELASDLKDALKKMENNIYIKPETLAKINEVQEKIEKMVGEDMKSLMSEINKNVERTKLSADDVKKLSRDFDEKKLVEKFERLKELFSKAEKEQKLATFMKELEFILSKQEFITENTEKAAPETADLNAELAREQRSASESYDKALANFEKNRNDVSEISEDIKRAAEKALESLKADDAGGELKKAGDALAKNDPAGAFEKQKKAAESIRRNLDALKKAFDEFKTKNKKELLEALSRLIRRTIAMSGFQHEIIGEFAAARGLTRPATGDKFVSTLDGASEKCIEIANASRDVASELTALSKKTILIDSNHIAAAGVLIRQFAQLRPLLAERELAGASNLAVQIYYNISALNMLLIDIFDIINSAKSGSNMDQLMSMIKKQAEAQARLNAKTKDMMKKAGENGMPQLSDDALKTLAFEQQMIRRSLERMMEAMDGDSEPARRLREIRSEMQNLEAEYLHKKTDAKIQSRQKVLHERLLDMQQALFKEKETTERKAERVKKYSPAAPAAPVEAQKVELRELKLDDSMKNEKYPRSYEKIIEMYFDAVKKF